jgi:hypothetical protein
MDELKLQKEIEATIYDFTLNDMPPSRIAKRIMALLPQWISVEDGLPEPYGEIVDGWSAFKERLSDILWTGKEWIHRDGVKVASIVTHWMPLQQPPKEG